MSNAQPASGLVLATVFPSAAFAAEPVTGRWTTDEGKAIVRTEPYGAAICGRLSRILAPTPRGRPVDERNLDPKLRHRAILGLQVLSGFTASGAGWHGRIYSPEEGMSYRSIMRRAGPDMIKGCIAFFCQTQIWKRAG